MVISRGWKTVIALFMCVLTLFAFGLKLALQAHAFAISAGIIGLIAVILGTLGFTFATSAELQRVCTQYYNQAPSAVQDAFTDAAAHVVNGVIKWADLSGIFLGVIDLITASLVDFVADGYSYDIINGINNFEYINRLDADGYAYPLAVSSLATVPLHFNEYHDSCWDMFTINGQIVQVRYWTFVHATSQGYFSIQFSVFKGSTRFNLPATKYHLEAGKYVTDKTKVSVAPCIKVVDGVKYLSIVWAMLCTDGITRYYGSDEAVLGLNLNDLGTTTVTDYYGQAGSIDDGIIGQAWSDAVAQQYDDTDVIDLTDSLPWIGAHDTTGQDVLPYTQSDVLTDVGIQDIVSDIANDIDTDISLDIDDYKIPPAWTVPSTGQTLRIADVFPFCIPFDIYGFLSLLSATRTAPHWEIPFKYDSIGLNYTFVIDFSGSVWQNLAQIVRTLVLIAFCVGLAFVTRDLIKG